MPDELHGGMDMQSKMVVGLFLAAIFVSAYYCYDRYIVRHDFVILQNEDGIPLIEE